MNWSNILNLLKIGETQYLHFLSSITNEDDLGPYLVAFANQVNGGKIVIGIDMINCHLLGVNSDIHEAFIPSLVKSYIQPEIKYFCNSIIQNNKKLLVISVNEGKNKPYLFKKKCYIKNQKTCHVADKDEEHRLLEKTRFFDLIKHQKAARTTVIKMPSKFITEIKNRKIT